MRAFLECIADVSPTVHREHVWREKMEPALHEYLVKRYILQPGPRATHYDCPSKGTSCPRRVVETPPGSAYPFQAVAPGTAHCCSRTYLTHEDVRTQRFYLPAFVELLRELFGLTGRMDLVDWRLPDHPSFWIGQQTDGTELDREVVYVPSLQPAELIESLVFRQTALRAIYNGAHGLVVKAVVPVRERDVAEDVERTFSPGDVVQFVFLDEVLRWNGSKVVLADGAEPRRKRPGPMTTVALQRQEPPFAVAISARGVLRILDRHEYHALVAQRDSYDLFIDMVGMKGLKCPARGTPTEGGRRDLLLTTEEAAVLIELMESEHPKPASELIALSGNHTGRKQKRVEEIRRLVDHRAIDTESGVLTWRLIPTVTAAGKAMYEFRPAAGLRCVAIRRLRPSEQHPQSSADGNGIDTSS